jgi:hypothetical protein
MSNAHKCLCLAASFLLISQLLAESFPKDAQGQLDNFCRRFSHRTAVVNNRLYIDGGFVNSNPLSQDPKNYTSK